MANSIKIKVSNYALIEYIYGTDEKLISQFKFNKLTNTSKGINIFINENTSATFSKNVLDYTFIDIEGGRIGHCDQDQPFTLVELDSNIILNESIGTPINYNVKYDTIRVHLISGYNLQGLDGFGFSVSADTNGGLKDYLSSIIYTFGENSLTQNPKPFSIGQILYDKYFEVKIPSLSYINEQFYNLSTFENKQLGYYLTSDNTGYVQESPIYIDFYNINNFRELDDRQTYVKNLVTETSVPQINPNDLLSGTIRESTSGDFFEYFATYDGELISDYISNLNSLGNVYSILHELNIYENYPDLTRKLTDSVTIVQNSNFDVVNKYRPIISNTAYSFIIEYNMRLINQTNNTQVIKSTSISCDTNCSKKYGGYFGKIEVTEKTSDIKIYNRNIQKNYTIDKTSILPSQSIQNSTPTQIIRFLDSYNISINSSHHIMNSAEVLNTSILNNNNFIFGNGKGYLYISPFDNHIKINLFKNNFITTEVLNINTFLKNSTNTNERMALVFYGANNIMKYIYANPNDINGNVVQFNIKSFDSIRIIDFLNKKFNIIYINSAGDKISLYEGKFTSSIEDYEDQVNKLYANTINEKIKELNDVYNKTKKDLDNLLSRLKDSKSLISTTQQQNEIINVTNNNNNGSGTTIVRAKDKIILDSKNIEVPISKSLEDSLSEERKDLLTSLTINNKLTDINKQADIIKSIQDALNSNNMNILDKYNQESNYLDIKTLNLSELPNGNNYYLDKSIKKLKPTFLNNIDTNGN